MAYLSKFLGTVFVTAEATAGVPVVAAAGNYFGHSEVEISKINNETMLNLKQIYADSFHQKRGQEWVEWRLKFPFQPSGTAGTAGNWSILFKNVFNETVNVGTDVQYVLSRTTTLATISVHYFDRGTETIITGAFPYKFTISGKDVLECEISGYGRTRAITGSSTCSAASATDTVITVADPNMFSVNSIIKFGADDNTGAGYRVTAVGVTEITIHAGLAADIAAAVTVTYMEPTYTIAENVISAYTGSLSFAGSTKKLQDASLEIDTGMRYILGLFGETNPVNVVQEAKRDITVSLEIPLDTADVSTFLTPLNSELTKAIVVQYGSTAGKKIKYTLSAVVFSPPVIADGEDGVKIVSLAGKALGSTGNDTITILQD